VKTGGFINNPQTLPGAADGPTAAGVGFSRRLDERGDDVDDDITAMSAGSSHFPSFTDRVFE
jgi:hypothetical protein